MKVDKLIKIADKAYPDGCIAACWDRKAHRPKTLEECGGAGCYDGLARFVAVEISETYDDDCSDDEQLEQAARAIQNAADELQRVADALADASGTAPQTMRAPAMTGPRRLATR
jgi:hypothetical protein